MTRPCCILLAVCLLLLAGLLAAPGAQESTARRKGYAVAVEIGEAHGSFVVALQPDGGLVLGGTQRRGRDDQLKDTLLRFTPDGHGAGFVTTTVGEVSDVLRGVAIQSDGRIVVAADSTGLANAHHGRPELFSLVRYTTAGQLDAAFGDGGEVFTQLSKVPPE